MAKIVKITRAMPRATLRSFEVGEELLIPHRIIRMNAVTTAACRIKPEGYLFECTENAVPAGIRVKRVIEQKKR